MRKKYIISSVIIVIGSLLILCSASMLYICFGLGEDYALDSVLFEKAGAGNTVDYLAFDRDGKVIQVYQSANGPRREWAHLDDISPYIKDGFIAVEDRDFYSHKGVNYKRTAAAFANCFLHFTSDFGGSTITQQVIKNISGDDERSVKRKISEMLRARRLEREYSKDEILSVYLNIVPMSGNIYGVATAAERFFGKDADALSLAEAATIVGITNSPARFNPYRHPDECIKRRNVVLAAMLSNGNISNDQYNVALSEPLIVLDNENASGVTPWFVETAESEICTDLASQYGMSPTASRLMLRGATVYLTVNPEIQLALDEYFSNPNNLSSDVVNNIEAAMTVVDNNTGNLVGIIGGIGTKSADRIINNALTKIPPASTIKPLSIYAPLLERGDINWASVFDDVPLSVRDAGGEEVAYPRNSPDRYDGLITVADAVRLSKNTVAMALYERLGAENAYGFLKNSFGFDLIRKRRIDGEVYTDLCPAALALGQLTEGVTLRELTDAYTVFPCYGEAMRTRSYYCVLSNNNELLLEGRVQRTRAINEVNAKIMCQLLSQVVESGTAKSISLKNTVDVGGKTGTSQGAKDRLFIGFTPSYTAGIWIGRRDYSDTRGVPAVQLQMWDTVMREISELSGCTDERTAFSKKGLMYLPYCVDSGCLITDKCLLDIRGERVAYGYFSSSNRPVVECQRHVIPDLVDFKNEDAMRFSVVKYKRILPIQVDVTDQGYLVCETPDKAEPFNVTDTDGEKLKGKK